MEINSLGICQSSFPLESRPIRPAVTSDPKLSWDASGCSLEELCDPAEGLPPGCGHRGGGLGHLAEAAAAGCLSSWLSGWQAPKLLRRWALPRDLNLADRIEKGAENMTTFMVPRNLLYLVTLCNYYL